MKNIFNYIPGFRSRKVWKMIVATVYYLISFAMISSGIGLFLFAVSIPFIVFNIYKGVKNKNHRFMATGIIAIILFCAGIILTPKVQSNSVVANKTLKIKNDSVVTAKTKKKTTKTYSKLDIDNIQASNGKIIMNGSTDLPDGSKIAVSFDVANQKNLSISTDAEVNKGAFSASLAYPDKAAYANGPYEVNYIFTPSGQSNDVLEMVGKNGENLSGSNMKTNNDLKINMLETSENPKLSLQVSTPVATQNVVSKPTTTSAESSSAPAAPVEDSKAVSTQPTEQNQSVNFSASVDNSSPTDNTRIHLTVSGPGGTYSAICHYKSKDTTYNGNVGTPISIDIGRAAKGYTVNIDISINYNGQAYSTSTSFTAR